MKIIDKVWKKQKPNVLYKIGIVGYGVVGRGIHRLFRESVFAIYDPLLDDNDSYSAEMMREIWKISHHTEINDKQAFAELDMVVISVPTDETTDWSADTSILEESLFWLADILPEHTRILIKSTTPPDKLLEYREKVWRRLVFSPEYMGESKYYTPPWKYPHPSDMQSHTWQIFGGDNKDTTFCVDIFKRRMGVDTQYWQTDIVTAALAKYIENSFFAMKVTFVNEWYDIAKIFGVDWNELRELWLLDPRINRNHTLVFPRDRGYGGKCLPKDTRAIMKEASDKGYRPELMLAMDKVNTTIRRKNK